MFLQCISFCASFVPLYGPKLSMLLITPLCFWILFRPARPAERETHRAAPGDRASFARAAAEAKPPRLPAAVRQAAPEDDGPASDSHRPRSPY